MSKSSSGPAIGLTKARKAVSTELQPTPLTLSQYLSASCGHNVYLKWENKFRTGSFKERGVVNFISQLAGSPRPAGVCAASAGNHALALSYHASKKKIRCCIFMPIRAPLIKIQTTKSFGAEVTLTGETYQEAAQAAQQFAASESLPYLSPFDDEFIIAGQSTCGSEIIDQCPDVDSIVVPVGGGGLFSGIALAVAESKRKVFLMGVQSEWASEQRWKTMPNSQISPVSLADGIAVKTLGTLTKPLVDKYADSLVSVSENEIARAMVQFLENEHSVAEGAAAAAIAGLNKAPLPRACRNTVVIVSGSNVDLSVLSRLLERDMGERGRLLRIVLSVPDRPGTLHLTAGIIAGAGANVLQAFHDRSFSKIPGNVEITFMLEVRDVLHGEAVLRELSEKGFAVRIVD